MKLIIRPSVLSRLERALEAAHEEGSFVKYIRITTSELKLLREEVLGSKYEPFFEVRGETVRYKTKLLILED